MLRLLVVAAAVLLVCSNARAEIMVAPSLEWLADHCFQSGIYVATAVHPNAGSDTVELALKLKKAFRGRPEKEIQQEYDQIRLSDPERDLAKKGDEFLICFQHYRTGEKRAVQIINLDHPQTAGFSVIAASCELKLLTTKKDILKVFEDRLKAHPKGAPVEISDYSQDNRFELQGGTELFSAIYGGSSCYLRVPQDLVGQVKEASTRLATQTQQQSTSVPHNPW